MTHQTSAVWQNLMIDPEAPAGFKFREAHSEQNPTGMTTLLETWEPGVIEDAHHHPHDDMTVMLEGVMEIQFHTRNELGELINDGMPLILKAGETGYIAANRVHSVKYVEFCRMVYVQDLDFGFIDG